MSSEPRVGHVVWDWNGTILDDNDAVVSAVNAVCTAFGRDHIDLDYWRSIYRRPLSEGYQELLARELSTQDWVEVDRLYHDAYRALLPTTRLAPGIPDELHRWRATGGQQSLLSMWFHDQLVPAVERHGLTRHFARIDGLRAEVGGGHKAPHLAAHVAAMGVDGADCVMIGDSVDDALAAASVGARCVLYSGGFTDAARLAEVGVPVVDSLTEAVAIAAAAESART